MSLRCLIDRCGAGGGIGLIYRAHVTLLVRVKQVGL